jgi:hypothetical protein
MPMQKKREEREKEKKRKRERNGEKEKDIIRIFDRYKVRKGCAIQVEGGQFGGG